MRLFCHPARRLDESRVEAGHPMPPYAGSRFLNDMAADNLSPGQRWTKLFPPSVAGQLLARDHLAGKLTDIGNKRLTLVCAPAGYGKTSVLVSAFNRLRALGSEPGWISLDHDDNDPARFVSHWCAAARLAEPGALARVPMQMLMAGFIDRLGELTQPSFIFLDDYHLVSDPSIAALVNAVLQAPLDRLHMVIATRDANHLKLGRLRLNDQLQTITATELGLSAHETQALFSRVARIDVAPAQIERIREKTEGWAAGVQLLAIAMRDRPDAAHFVESFSGEHASVADFLAEEVFRLQPGEVQAFLLATSVLSRFDTALAEAVSGLSNAREMLTRLEHANLFIFCLDDERSWYRYHHLFTDFLRRKLREEHPGLLPVLHARASEWFAAHGHAVESIEHAFGAGQMLRAAQLLDQHSQRLISGGRSAELMSFASRLPDSLLDQMPGAVLDEAWQLIACWRFSEARILLDRVAKLIAERSAAATTDAQHRDAAFLRSKLSHRELVLAVTRDDLPLTLRLAEDWLAADSIHEPVMRATASSIANQARREFYRWDGIAAASKALGEQYVQGGGYFSSVYHDCVCGAAFFARGEFAAAEQHYRRSHQTAVELHGERSALSAFPAAMLAELHYERNEQAEAAQLLRAHGMSADFGLVDKLVAGFVTRARLACLRGQTDEAERALDDASYFATEYEFTRLQVHVLGERVRMRVAEGDAKAAGRLLLESRTPSLPALKMQPGEGVTSTDELFATAHARAWIANGRVGDAVALLRPWLAWCRSRHCIRSAIRLSMLLAGGYLRDGNRLAAQRTLVQALKLGESGPFVRAYLDEGGEVVQALSELGAVAVAQHPFDWRHLQAVLAAHGDTGRAGLAAPPASAGAVREQISERELQIIRLAAQGLPNGEIAGSMCLAESTVKWYWQRIFDKLDVRRRVDAVKQARQLHWIR
ncbi:LuxR C-terminal-related transcriptional regulator [Paraburkholderia sp. J63]|uniref:LuxR C-terminal-related transcriptional regulator n=1 Tax=Paraburkholderia sp. J63 TaxID=2805434 RepID=UPI002ABE8975|nr:LuxR C-terminal-related transcriptional regulator [Paraburkholderia sp. J63]